MGMLYWEKNEKFSTLQSPKAFFFHFAVKSDGKKSLREYSCCLSALTFETMIGNGTNMFPHISLKIPCTVQ